MQSTAPGFEIKGNSALQWKAIEVYRCLLFMSYCEQADILTLPLLCVWIILASKYILDKTNIFQRQIALLSFKLGGTMKDKHVENWLTSSKCFCLSLITLQNGSLTSLSHLTKNQIGETRHRLIILVERKLTRNFIVFIPNIISECSYGHCTLITTARIVIVTIESQLCCHLMLIQVSVRNNLNKYVYISTLNGTYFSPPLSVQWMGSPFIFGFLNELHLDWFIAIQTEKKAIIVKHFVLFLTI